MLAIEIEMTWRSIDLERGARLRCGGVERVEVHRIARPAANQAIGRVGDDVDQWMPDRLEAALRQCRTVLTGGVVQRSEHDVQLGQDRIIEIQAAIGQDIDLEAMQDGDRRKLLPKTQDLVTLARQRVQRERPGGGGPFRVVGDGDVLVAQGDRSGDHRRQGVLPIAVGGVHVQIAADVSARNRDWQVASRSGGDLTRVVAHLGGDESQPRVRVNLFFGLMQRRAPPGRYRAHVGRGTSGPEERASVVIVGGDVDIDLDARNPQQGTARLYRCRTSSTPGIAHSAATAADGTEAWPTSTNWSTRGSKRRTATGWNNVFEPGAVVGNEILDGRQQVDRPPERQRLQFVSESRARVAKGRRHWLELAIYTAVVKRRPQVREGNDSKLSRELERLLLVDGLEFEKTTNQGRKPGAAGAERGVRASGGDLSHPP